MKNWENIEYQTIQKATAREGTLTIGFENGDVVKVEIRSILPFIDASLFNQINDDSLVVSSFSIKICVRGEEYEIPWDKIRVLTDVDYSRAMADLADEQSRQVGVKLKKLRERKGIKANDLAAKSGISAQTISRVEKGHNDIGFSTLRKLLASMGYSLQDLAREEFETEQPAKDASYSFLIKKLASIGFDKSFLAKRIIPKTIHDALSKNNKSESILLLNEAAAYVAEIFDYSVSDILSHKELALPLHKSSTLYKLPSNVNINQIKAYTHYSHYISRIVLKGLTGVSTNTFPKSTDEFIRDYFKKFRTLDLESLLDYVWDLGIVVIPLSDSGLFHGASWRIDDRFVIVLKQKSNYHSRWIFDLLHELYHIFDHLQDEQLSLIVEYDEISPFSGNESTIEREANSFANIVLFNGKADSYAQECVVVANGNISSLQSAVKKVASKYHVREDNLANYLALRLSYQNQQWWAQSSKLQTIDPSPYKLALDRLKSKISRANLRPMEESILEMALVEN